MNPPPFFVSTFCCHERPLDKALDLLSRHTSRVEILSDGPHHLLQDDTPCSGFPLAYSVHAPASDLNIAAVSERMRSASVAELDEMLAACSRIGAEHLVVHPGYSAYEQTRERSSNSLLRSLDELAILQEEHGVAVCVENMGRWECCHFRTPSLIPELTERGLGWTLDCGHAQVNGNLGSFLAAGGFCHVHLHDNRGTDDDHIACGEGTIDFPNVVSALPRDATLVIETRELDAASRSVQYLTSIMNGEP